MDTHSDPNTSVQPAQLALNQTMMNQTTADRTEKNKYKIPILSDRETDLTKINPRMLWEQISDYIHLTYNRNLDEMMDQGTDQMDPHTVYHIKGYVIWALGPKAKHEIERPMGQRAERRRPIRTIETIQENIHSREKCFSQSSPILQYQTRGQRNTRWILEKTCWHRKKMRIQ